MQPSSVLFGSALTFLLLVSAAHGFSADNLISGLSVIDSPLLTQKIGTNRTIKVDMNGKDEFTSVQAAIDSIPEGNSEWIIVHLRKGVYRERVLIPSTKPYIFLRGNGKGKTYIISDQASKNNTQSATLRIEASNVIVFGISFKNEANMGQPASLQVQNQSVAVVAGADKIAFYHCAFYSAHNTLFDYKGRHYYDNCYIQGSVDFIFGRGQSVFQGCEIFVNADSRLAVSGSVTAHYKKSKEENSGFVFLKGKVYGIGGVYLGRARGEYSRTIFAKTYLSKTILPQGWTNWSYNGTTANLLHAEYDCHGPGADSNGRADWSRQLTDEEAQPFLSVDFINGKEWLPAYHSLDAKM